MANVIDFKPFRMPKSGSEFTPLDVKLSTELMIEDCAKSGLDYKDIGAFTHGILEVRKGANAGYCIPYPHPQGGWLTNETNECIAWRNRLFYPVLMDGPKYIQPTEQSLTAAGLPSTLLYTPPAYHTLKKSSTLYVTEGEKKAGAMMKILGVSTVGIGGCWMWQYQGKLHPWFKFILPNHSNVCLVTDGDILNNFNVSRAFGAFARELESKDVEVSILKLPEANDKIDDLLVEWGPEAQGNFDELERIGHNDLIASPAALQRKYNLAFEMGGSQKNPKVNVFQHSANVTMLMEAHPAFSQFWRNLDTDEVYHGEEPLLEDVSEVEIANYFQYYLGFNKVNDKLIDTCIAALAGKNSRSPFGTWVNSLEWDKKPRLDTWLIRLWGAEDTEYNRAVGSKFIVSSCARLATPGVKVDWLPIWVGEQGIGKTSVQSIIFRGLDAIVYGDNKDKDFKMLVHSCLCLVLDEMDSFGRRDHKWWKSFISDPVDNYRPPYGKKMGKYPRMSVMAGTSNNVKSLPMDATGHRRYRPVTLGGMLEFKLLEDELEQLWAEAQYRMLAGEVYWEVDDTEGVVDEYFASIPLEDGLAELLESVQSGLGGWMVVENKDSGPYYKLTKKDIFEALDMKGQLRNSAVNNEIENLMQQRWNLKMWNTRGIKHFRIGVASNDATPKF